MTDEEYYAALKKIEALQDCRNDEECGELERLTIQVKKQDESFSLGSGNVFEDLGLDNPEEELRRAKLGLENEERYPK